MAYINPRGSEWSRWDLHVHTPLSIIQHFKKGASSDVWEEYISDLENLPPEFKVIGINDYMFIDGYRKVLEYKESGRLSNIDLILPVVEFRIKKFAGHEKFKRINFHVIFSDELGPDLIQNQFLNGLTTKYQLSPGLGSGVRWQGIPTYDSLTDLGRQIKSTVPADRLVDYGSDLIEGFNNLNLDEEDIINLLTKSHYFTGKFLLTIGKTEWDELPWGDGTIGEKKDIINKSHMVFTASESTERYSIAKNKLIEQQVNDLLLDCSDAHYNSSSSEKDRIGNCFTWIKADRTFNGLRQVIIEPNRIYVGNSPEILERVKTNSTKYIKSISIEKDSLSSLTEKWFEDINIELNSELVAIIGNKGNGKSAITDIIGLLGDTKNHTHFSFLRAEKFKKPNPNRAASYNATLQWHSAESNQKNLNDKVNPSSFERVKYLPQNFLEALCNDEDDQRFENELRKVIFSHVDEPDRLNQDSLENLINYHTETLDERIARIQLEIQNLNKHIIELEKWQSPLYKEALLAALKNKENELVEHKAIKPTIVIPPENNLEVKTEQALINSKITELRTKIEEIKATIALRRENKLTNNTEATTLNKIALSVQEFEDSYFSLKTKYSELLGQLGISFDDIIQISINKDILAARIASIKLLISQIDIELGTEATSGLIKESKEIDEQLQQLQNKLDVPSKQYQQYLNSIGIWQNKEKEIIGDKNIDGSIEYYKFQLNYLDNTLKVELNKLRSERIEKVKVLFATKVEIVGVYKTLYKPITDFMSVVNGLSTKYPISVDASLKMDDFADRFFYNINQSTKGSFYGREEGNSILDSLIEGRDFNDIKNVEELLNKTIEYLEYDQRDGQNKEKREIQLQMKKGVYNDFYDFLFGLDYLIPSFELKLDNKHISELSPGEKGSLLLIFYLILDRDEVPLIIDQPEENLDNQSVFDILVPFIKDAKKHRQIIIVTHNPNLAIVCDAEQIINVKIDKFDGYKVSIQTGAIESLDLNKKAVDILEGTLFAFNNRDTKYSITKESGLSV